MGESESKADGCRGSGDRKREGGLKGGKDCEDEDTRGEW